MLTRFCLILFSILLAGTAQCLAQHGYIITQGGDSLTGTILYQDDKAALHLTGLGPLQTISTSRVARFSVYDPACLRYRHYERIDKLDSLAPEGALRLTNRPVFCEALPLQSGGRLLRRAPYRYIKEAAPPLADAVAEEPVALTHAERKLRRQARRHSRRFAGAEAVYYVQQADSIRCLSPVRRFWRMRYRVQDVALLLRQAGNHAQQMRDWIRRKGNPLNTPKRMEAFVHEFCWIDQPDYAQP